MNDSFESVSEGKKRERSADLNDSPSPISKLIRKDPVMEEILKEVKATRKEITDSEERIKLAIDTKIQPLQDLEPAVQSLTKRVENLEKTVLNVQCEETRRNIIVFGFPEKHNEGWRDISRLVNDLGRKLNYSRKIDFDTAYRIGRKNSGKDRPVIIKLLRLVDKYEILSLTNNLRGTSLSIDEDFNPDERKIKGLLRNKALRLRRSFPEMKTRVYVRRNELWTFMEGSSTMYEVSCDMEVTEKKSNKEKPRELSHGGMEIEEPPPGESQGE